MVSGGGPLPHFERIQAAFGHHDVGGVQAHVGGAAAAASRDLSATAYATGNHVAFAAAPDLHTAAHEAAHVVQQRGGVQLKGGVGQVGDRYEQHADQVADAVVQGKSAEALLDPFAGSPTETRLSAGPQGGGSAGVQRRAVVQREAAPEDETEPLGPDAETAEKLAIVAQQLQQIADSCRGSGNPDSWAFVNLLNAKADEWYDAVLGGRASRARADRNGTPYDPRPQGLGPAY